METVNRAKGNIGLTSNYAVIDQFVETAHRGHTLYKVDGGSIDNNQI